MSEQQLNPSTIPYHGSLKRDLYQSFIIKTRCTTRNTFTFQLITKDFLPYLQLSFSAKSKTLIIECNDGNQANTKREEVPLMRPLQNFEFLVVSYTKSLQIYVHKIRVADFPHAIPIQDVTQFAILPDVVIHKLSVTLQSQKDNTFGVDSLHDAAVKGDLDAVNKLLEANTNVNIKDILRQTPLMLAAENDRLEVVKRLLQEKNVNVNVRERATNATALHFASQRGFVDIVKLLVKHGANVNLKMMEGYTPLHTAIHQHHVETALFLIASGVNVFAIDDLKWNPLHNAVYNGCSLEIVKELVKNGVNINLKINDGRTVLHFAAEFNHHEIARYLIEEGATVTATDEKLWTPLHNAAYDGNIEVAKLLLDNGASIDYNTAKQNTPLHFAAYFNQVKAVEFLLENGANANALDRVGWTPLHFAAKNGHHRVADVLMKHGANCNVHEKQDGCTPLHFAGKHGFLKLAKTLIKGSKVNARMHLRATALHLAASTNQPQVAGFLLENGAYFDAVAGPFDQTPLDVSLKAGSKIPLLDIIKCLFEAINAGNLTDVQVYLQIGSPANCRSVRYKTPLLLAIKLGHAKIVQCLLDSKADPNLAVKKHTPLGCAIKCKHFSIVCSLIKHGALFHALHAKSDLNDPLISDLLCLLVEVFDWMEKGDVRAIELLKSVKERDVKLFRVITLARNDDSLTLLQVAIRNRHKEAAVLLANELKNL